MQTMRRQTGMKGLALALLAVGVLGLVLRYTVKDRIPSLAVVFYGLAPLPVAGALVFSLTLCLWQRARRWAILSGVVAWIGIVAWLTTDYVHNGRPRRTAESMRIVLWNLARPAANEDGFLRPLQEANGQIMLLVESGTNTVNRREFWTSHFPHHYVSILGAGITLLSAYPVSEVALYAMGEDTHIGVYDLAAPFGPLSVIAVDIESNPLAPRGPFIDRIRALAAARPHPVIILGDFNTPHTSAHFDALRRSFRHAFAESGNGLITTWPALVPMLAIDHIWLSPDLTPVYATIRRTLHSDHALVIADVNPNPAAPDESFTEPAPD